MNIPGTDAAGATPPSIAPLRIALLMTVSLESPAAVGRYLPLARELRRLGHSVTLLALYHDLAGWNRQPFDMDGVTVRYVGAMHVRKRGNVKTYYAPWQLVWVILTATLGFVVALWRTPHDLVQVCKPHPQNSVAAWLVSLLRGTPIFVDCDDFEAVNNRFSGAWQQRGMAWFEDAAIRRAQGVTAGNHFLLARAAAIRGSDARLALVRNGVDRHRFAILHAPQSAQAIAELRHLHFGDSAHRVVYVGSISLTSHALDLLLAAWVQVVARQPDARLLIVGGGEDFAQVRALVDELGIADTVSLAGKVAGAQAPLYYRTAQISVDPMHQSLPAASSLSLKIAESLAAGVPCVTADIGDRAEVIGGAGIAVPPDNETALADALLLLLTQERLRQTMRAACPQAAESAYWDVKAPQFIQLYRTAP